MSPENTTTSGAVRNLIICDTQFGLTGSTTLKLQQLLDLQARGWLIEGNENNEFSLTVEGHAVVARALQQAGPAELAEQQVAEMQGDALIDAALGYRSTALDDLDSCPDRRPGIMVTEAMHALREAIAARQAGAQEPHGSEFAVSRTMEDAEAASDGMPPAALVPVANEWYRLCERRFAVDRIRIGGKLAEAIVDAVCAAPPAQGIDLGPGVRAIADERQRQAHAEGFSAENDADYKAGVLANAALAYLQVAAMDLAAGGAPISPPVRRRRAGLGTGCGGSRATRAATWCALAH